MKKAIVLIAVLVSVVAWWLVAYPSGTWRYKMTVTIDTPEGLKTGSAVREIYAYSHPPLLGVSNDTFIRLQKGEAVVVDLGDRGVLFALLSSPTDSRDHAIWAPFHAFPSPCGYVSRCAIKHYRALKSSRIAELSPRHYPALIGLKRESDQTKLRRVLDMEPCDDPTTGVPNNSLCVKNDHFEDIFGQGVRLHSIQIEMTNQFFTQSTLEDFLPLMKGKAFHRNNFIVAE